MRVRSILLVSFWGALFIWVGYNGMQAGSSYFSANRATEDAFRDASDRQRLRNPSELFSSDFLADLRTTVVAGARRQGITVDPSTLKVAAEGGLVNVAFGWTYRTWPLTIWDFDTRVPVPMWLSPSFDAQMGLRRSF